MSLSYENRPNGYRWSILDSCPFCEYEFDHGERRDVHFAENHGPEVIPSPSEARGKPATMRGRGGAD